MSRLRTSFRLSLEKLDDRLCLSGTTMDTFASEAPPPEMEPAHVRVFSGNDFSAYGGFSGGVRVAAADVDSTGWGNDWISGGTGQDGVGVSDDVVVDGRIITAENPVSATGGALDVLIGNTGYDRVDPAKDEVLSISSEAPTSSSGANFLLLDGSVRFNTSVDLTIEQAAEAAPAKGKEYLNYSVDITNAN